jgi:hypothetical protein
MERNELPTSQAAMIPDFSRLPMMGAAQMELLVKAQTDLLRVFDESGKAWFAMAQHAADASAKLANGLRGASPVEDASLYSNWIRDSATECATVSGQITALWTDFCGRAASASRGNGAGAPVGTATAQGPEAAQGPNPSGRASKAA